MASFVAKQNQFAMLANAFTGVAKGANDYAQLKQRRDALNEQKRQHDQNLKLGFDRLDEQIRSFDIQTEQKEALQKQAELARSKFQDTEIAYRTEADDKRIAAEIKKAGIAAHQQAETRKLNRQIQQQNIGLSETVNTMQTLGAGDLHRERAAHETKVADWTPNDDGTFTDAGGNIQPAGSNVFQYETRRNAIARNLASRVNFTDNPTESQIALAAQQVDNHPSLHSTNNQNRMDAQLSKNLSNAAAAGAYGSSYTGAPMTAAYEGIYYSKQLDENGNPTVIERPAKNAFADMRAQLAAAAKDNPYAGIALSNYDRAASHINELSNARQQGTEVERSTAEARLQNIMNPANFPGIGGENFAEIQRLFNNESAANSAGVQGDVVWAESPKNAAEFAFDRQLRQEEVARESKMTPQQRKAVEESSQQTARETAARGQSIAATARARLLASGEEPTAAVLSALDEMEGRAGPVDRSTLPRGSYGSDYWKTPGAGER